MSSVVQVDSRTQESQRGLNGLSWFMPIGALRLAADDPKLMSTQNLGVITECKGERERFGRGLLSVDPWDALSSVEPSLLLERRKVICAVEELLVALSGLLCSQCQAQVER
jgi:hypothetical protein